MNRRKSAHAEIGNSLQRGGLLSRVVVVVTLLRDNVYTGELRIKSELPVGRTQKTGPFEKIRKFPKFEHFTALGI